MTEATPPTIPGRPRQHCETRCNRSTLHRRQPRSHTGKGEVRPRACTHLVHPTSHLHRWLAWPIANGHHHHHKDAAPDWRLGHRPPRRRCPRRAAAHDDGRTAHAATHRATSTPWCPASAPHLTGEDPSRVNPSRQGTSRPHRRRQRPGRARPRPMAAAGEGRRGAGGGSYLGFPHVATRGREEET
jgi:hypothetical protein